MRTRSVWRGPLAHIQRTASRCVPPLFAPLLPLLLVLAGAAGPEARGQESSPTVRIVLDAEQIGEAKPWLVTFLFDLSGSMTHPPSKPEFGLGRFNSRWDACLADARGRLEELLKKFGSFQLQAYGFNDTAAEWDRGRWGNLMTIRVPADIDAAMALIRDEGKLEGSTNLWQSVSNLLEGGEKADLSVTHAGSYLLIFTDGEDFLGTDRTGESRRRFEKMLARFQSAKSRIELRMAFSQVAELGDRAKREMGQIGALIDPDQPIPIPVVERLGVLPEVVDLGKPLRSGESGSVFVDLSAIADPGRRANVQCRPVSTVPGIDVRWENPNLVLRRTGGAPNAVELTIGCTVPGVEGGTAATLDTSFRVAIPGATMVPDLTTLLPPACPEANGERMVLLARGETLEWSLAALPPEVSVAWTVDGQPAGSSRVLRRFNLVPGRHEITFEVRTADDRKQESFAALVIDPTLSVTAPDAVVAGSPARFSTSLPTDLPPRLRPGPSSFRWTGASPTPIATDGEFATSFLTRGSGTVTVTCAVTGCGRATPIVLTGRSSFDIQPGPSLRLLGGALVRGRPGFVVARVSQPDGIAEVVFTVTPGEGGAPIRVVAAVTPDAGDPAVGTATASFATEGSVKEYQVSAVPILLDDTGRKRAETDPECEARRQIATYTVRDPQVELRLSPPGPLTWSGRNVEPPPVGVEVVFPDGKPALPVTVDWSTSDGMTLKASPSDPLQATLEIQRAGDQRVSATVRMAGATVGRAESSFEAVPAPVVPGPSTRTRFDATSPVEIDHAGTGGAWRETKVRARPVGAAEWQALPADLIWSPTPTADLAVEYEVWYRPWGAGESDEPWQPGSGWIASKPLPATLLKPRVWWITILAILGAIAMSILLVWLAIGHHYRWVRVAWNKSPYMFPESFVRNAPKPRYHFLRKALAIRLPSIRGEPEFEWTEIAAKGAHGRATIELRSDDSCQLYVGVHALEALLGSQDQETMGGLGMNFVVPPLKSIDPPIGAAWQPIYLWITPTGDSKQRDLLIHWILMVGGGMLATWGTIAYLFQHRII